MTAAPTTALRPTAASAEALRQMSTPTIAPTAPDRLMFDGWYSHREMAEGVLELVAEEGALVVGLVRSPTGTYGILYFLPPGVDPAGWHFPEHAFFEGGRASFYVPRREAAA